MNIAYRNSALAPTIALCLALSSSPLLAGDTSQAITEARQESQIWTTYVLSPYLRAHEISVSVHEGTATLTGKVDEEVNKELARQIALGVKGIDAVDNQIVVQGDYVPAPRTDHRRFGDRVDDASITAAVKSKLLWSRHTEGLQTEVETAAGEVTLKGRADTQEAKNYATRIALNTPGVRSVDNRLQVGPGKPTVAESAADAASTMRQDMSDSWITTKVKSTFMYSSNVNSSDISVSTRDGIVTLSGTVSSGAERALAIEFAQNVRGVKSVDSKGLHFDDSKAVASAQDTVGH